MELGQDRTVAEIISRLKIARGGGVVKVEGTWGSFAPLLVAYISKMLNRPILYIRPHIDDADKAADDLHTFGAENAEAFVAWEGEEELADATDEIRTERLKLISSISHGISHTDVSNLIIPTSIQALCQPIPKPQALEKSCLQLQTGKTMSMEQITEWLIKNGFERVERIDLPGQFAHRGGIVDIYAPLSIGKTLSDEKQKALPPQGTEAIRVEFFGDTIESIREINLDTQRSSQEIKGINILSAVCGTTAEERELFVNILPKDTIIILEEPNDIEEVAKLFRERAEDSERLYSWQDIFQAIGKFTQLHICSFSRSILKACSGFSTKLPRYGQVIKRP
jgi:transcription-repair coupling factor (superfamily II helicase)